MDQAKTLVDEGFALWRCENLDAARRTFEELLQVAQGQQCGTLEATAWNNLAVIFRELGESARAVVCQQQSWRAALDSSRDDPGAELPAALLSGNLTNLANDAILAGDYDLAERLLASALDIDVRAGNSADEAADWGSLGIVAYLTGRLEQADRCFAMAYRIHERLGDVRGLAQDLGHLGQLALANEDWLAARRFFEQSEFHFERSGCRRQARQARQSLREMAALLRVANFCPARN